MCRFKIYPLQLSFFTILVITRLSYFECKNKISQDEKYRTSISAWVAAYDLLLKRASLQNYPNEKLDSTKIFLNHGLPILHHMILGNMKETRQGDSFAIEAIEYKSAIVVSDLRLWHALILLSLLNQTYTVYNKSLLQVDFVPPILKSP